MFLFLPGLTGQQRLSHDPLEPKQEKHSTGQHEQGQQPIEQTIGQAEAQPTRFIEQRRHSVPGNRPLYRRSTSPLRLAGQVEKDTEIDERSAGVEEFPGLLLTRRVIIGEGVMIIVTPFAQTQIVDYSVLRGADAEVVRPIAEEVCQRVDCEQMVEYDQGSCEHANVERYPRVFVPSENGHQRGQGEAEDHVERGVETMLPHHPRVLLQVGEVELASVVFDLRKTEKTRKDSVLVYKGVNAPEKFSLSDRPPNIDFG